jgi:hypothetical protein
MLALGAHGALAQPPAGSPPQRGDQPVDPYAEPAAPAPEPGPDPEPEGAPPPSVDAGDDIDDQVAQGLYRRGVELYKRGAAADAKRLFIESLERSPRGRVSGEALRMLRAANRRLGIANQDDGRPSARNQETVLDPYGGAATGGGATSDEGPLDPYGESTPEPPAPAAGAGEGGMNLGVPPEPPSQTEGSVFGRSVVMAWSGAVGLVAGLALAGPEDDFGDISDGAVIAGAVGAAGGVGLSYWLTRRWPPTRGESTAIASGASWGGAIAGLLGDATTGTDTEANQAWKYVAAGGLVGLGGGVLVARMASPSEGDVAVTNSLAAYGAALGLGIAAGMDPPESEAYSLNALFGATAGIAAGVLLSPRLEVSRRRTLFLDIGAAAGAAASWGLLYPLMSDDTTHNDEQVAGWVSTVTLSGGVVLAWYLTRDMDERAEPLAERSSRRRRGLPAAPALARRDSEGEWKLGVPFLRPLHSAALAPPGRHSALGIDLLSGRF